MDATHAEHEVRALLAVMDELELQWLLRPETDLETVFASHLNATVDRWRRDPS